MPIAAEKTSGYRHSTATALKAPIDAPPAITSRAWTPRSAWMAGTTSRLMHSWNWLSSHIRCSADPVLATIARPATLSAEYSLTRPSASSGPHASTRPWRSISSASPPAEGKISTGRPRVPHRATVISSWSRPENHRSTVFTALLIPELLRARKDPGQSLPQPVAPVLPAVAVPGLDIPDVHPGGLERRHHGPVRRDQRLVDPAADEHPVRDLPRRRPVPVDEFHHRLERWPAAVGAADVGEDERPGLQQQRAIEPRVPERGRQRCHRAEARPHQAPAGRRARQRELGLQPWHQLSGQVPGVRRRVGVLGQPFAR